MCHMARFVVTGGYREVYRVFPGLNYMFTESFNRNSGTWRAVKSRFESVTTGFAVRPTTVETLDLSALGHNIIKTYLSCPSTRLQCLKSVINGTLVNGDDLHC